MKLENVLFFNKLEGESFLPFKYPLDVLLKLSDKR